VFSWKYAQMVADYTGAILPFVETIYPTTIILLARLKKTEINSTLQWLSSQEQSNGAIELASQPEGNSSGVEDDIIEVERDAVVAY
jgi:hypothetical protein